MKHDDQKTLISFVYECSVTANQGVMGGKIADRVDENIHTNITPLILDMLKEC